MIEKLRFSIRSNRVGGNHSPRRRVTSGFTLSEFLGGAPGDPGFADPKTLTVSIITCMLVVALSQFGKGMLKALSYLIALAAGTILSLAFGMADFSEVASKPWIGLPKFMPYGGSDSQRRHFRTVFHSLYGGHHGSAWRVPSRQKSKEQSLKTARCYGLAGEAAGSAVSSLIGGFTTTAYPQNVALLKVTDEGKTRTRVPVIIAGAVFVTLGFIPKAGCTVAHPLPGNRRHLPAGGGQPHQHRTQHVTKGGEQRSDPSGDRPIPPAWHRIAKRIKRT